MGGAGELHTVEESISLSVFSVPPALLDEVLLCLGSTSCTFCLPLRSNVHHLSVNDLGEWEPLKIAI